MKRRTVLFLLMLLLPFLGAAGQDFSVGTVLCHPGADSTEVSAGWRLRAEDRPRLMQEGSGLSEGFFDARVRRHLSSDEAVRGHASYRRGIKRAVRWNSASDFDLLYPYVLADSVGGDLQTETYSFGGAYACRRGRLVSGISGTYRALHEYRQVDPRPRNITSDFSVDASAGYAFGTYVADLTLGYRRYFQTQTVSFMNQRGANTSEFHLTGLGSHFGRFEGTSAYTSTYYRGQGFQAGCSVYPQAGAGLRAGVLFSHISFVRHLSSQNEAPITQLGVDRVRGFAQWLSNGRGGRYAVTGQLLYERRAGQEHVIANMSTGSFETLMKLPMYARHSVRGSLTGEMSRLLPSGGAWSLRPVLAVYASRAEHRYPSREASLLLLSASLRAGRLLPLGRRALLDAGIASGFTASPSHSLSLPSAYTMPRLLEDYQAQFAVLTDSRTDLLADARLSFRAGEAGVSPYLRACVCHGFHGGGYGTDGALLSVGLLF